MPGTDSSLHTQTTSPSQAERPLPPAPYQYAGGDLGLNLYNGIAPWIYFYDQSGTRWMTRFVQTILSVIDEFSDESDRQQILALTAPHFGFDDLWTLIEGPDYGR